MFKVMACLEDNIITRRSRSPIKVKSYCLVVEFIFLVLLLFSSILCPCQVVKGEGQDDASESAPENSIVFKSGDPNGKPASPDDPLVEGEFSILSGKGNTIQVRSPEQFPQILLPGQRIAVFLPGLEKKHILLETMVVNKWSQNYDQQPLISILFNKKLLHKSLLHKTSNPIRIIIPSN